MKTVNMRVFKYFIVTAQEGNITKAAKILHLTQPTLSRQLKQLEEEMNVELFNRGRYSVTLTEKGKIFLESVKKMVAVYETAQEALLQPDEGLKGEIVIGCGETRGMDYLASEIALFRKKYPRVTFQIYSSTADDIKVRLENGTIDMGLLTEPVEVEKYEYIRIKEKDFWGAYVRKDSPLAEKQFVSKEDLKDEMLILPTRGKVQKELGSWFGEYAEQLKVAATGNLVLNAGTMVKNDVGVMIALELPVFDRELCFVPLFPELRTGSVLVWKHNKESSQVTKKFIRQLRNTK